MDHGCDNLERFLLDDLASADAAAFEAHVANCETCRDAIDQQRWIDGLIRSPERVKLETPPVELAGSIAASLARRRRLAACGLAATAATVAAAAALMIAAGWTALQNLQNHQAMPIAATNIVADASNAPTHSTFIGGDDVIVVPVESPYPNVTVVRVYRTYRPDVADQANFGNQPEVDDFFLPDEFNGG